MEERFLELIKKILNKQIQGFYSTGTAVNINAQNRSCDIQLSDELTLYDCRLNAIVDSYNNHLLILPKENSTVGFIQIAGSTKDVQIITFSQIDTIDIIIGSTTLNIQDGSITLNGGSLGGLINIQQLTDKLNSLISTFNTHTHVVPNGTSNVPSSTMPSLNKSSFEDNKIKH